jgi:hypothetical protein
MRVDLPHHQPQQSVLNPQPGHRQTACILYISAPQRSQSTASAEQDGEVLTAELAERTAVMGRALPSVAAF